MGTRHIVGVVSGGKYRLAQYGQWDGYPAYTGAMVVEFLSKPENVGRLTNGLQNIRQVTEEDSNEILKSLD